MFLFGAEGAAQGQSGRSHVSLPMYDRGGCLKQSPIDRVHESRQKHKNRLPLRGLASFLPILWVHRGLCNMQHMKTSVAGQALGPETDQKCFKLSQTATNTAQQLAKTGGVLQRPR